MAKLSTYARLLKPGQRFYTKDDYKTFTVVKVEVTHVSDNTTVTLGNRSFGPTGSLVMVKVTVEERSNALIFDDTDRVELI